MAKKDKTEKPLKSEESESEIYYVVNIYDNHGTINITQTGKPGGSPPPPPPEGGE